jgi:hypothetical protein
LIQDQAQPRKIDSKNPFVRIRLFQILIPQLHFGDFFNTIGQLRSSEDVRRMTVLTLEADLAGSRRDVSAVPIGDICKCNKVSAAILVLG